MSGGGDGGEASARAEQRELEATARQQKEAKARKSAIARVNALFGYGSLKPAQQKSNSRGTAPLGVSPQWDSLLGVRNRAAGQSTLSPQWARLLGVGDRGAGQSLINPADILRNRQLRNQTYADVGQDVSNFMQRDLNKQNRDTSRDLGFELARRGQLGGSVQTDQEGELQLLRDRGLVDIHTKADRAKQSLRSSDENARLTAIRDINADVDAGSALQGAMEHLRTASESAYTEGIGQPAGDFFRQLSYLYGASQGQQGYQDARGYYGRGASGPSNTRYGQPHYGS